MLLLEGLKLYSCEGVEWSIIYVMNWNYVINVIYECVFSIIYMVSFICVKDYQDEV